MVTVVRYSDRCKLEWDAFIKASKNGTFLFLRDYMEYHADRFEDHSLLFYLKEKLVAVLPANAMNNELHSHAGLSYGGVVSGHKMKVSVMLQVFEALAMYSREQHFKSLYYKATPHIYHQVPAEEDLYALFRYGAVLYRRDVNSVIDLGQPVRYSKDRRWRLSQCKSHKWEVRHSEDYADFMQLVATQLESRHKLKPVHTAAEVEKLAQFFPKNISLYITKQESELLAGALVYETAAVAHCQYIGASERAQEQGAAHVLVDHLINEVYPHKKYFSFGISTEQQGLYLNEGLASYKESYGARTVVHDFYRLDF
ncbi:GNAT family N-acetyltransferase [Pontibacter lucknowensis]|uniref:Acetyltransferase (GNAT) domain-containing protein n=1 Tax=Pontibacter lucknowensis TaxID=1077936 RepID=A0A1N6UHX1_9BACT|nr:GNAT family N-acetyltransferase [Pontibacter lucknowensis]SIQ65183.1 Acetyltransferase (GNAT) domain-containing protein [Pontibacter lucknowensis]